MQCMFPELIQGYKEKIQRPPDQIVDDQPMCDIKEIDTNNDTNVLCNEIMGTRLFNALNLEGLNNVANVGKTHYSYEALNLNTTDLELCQLIHQRSSNAGNMKTELVESSVSVTEEDPVRTKRMKKPSAKMIENNEVKAAVLKSKGNSRKRKNCSKNNFKENNKKVPIKSDLVNCEVCGKELQFKRLETHMLLHTKDSKFTCDICGKVSGTKSDLENHKLIHGEYNYHCQYCSQKFKQPAPYRVHMRMHTVENNWMCDICFKTFKFQGELKEHCLQEHSEIGKDPQRCCVCKELLKSWNSVYKHSVGHSGVRSHECELCEKKFKHKSHLEVSEIIIILHVDC